CETLIQGSSDHVASTSPHLPEKGAPRRDHIKLGTNRGTCFDISTATGIALDISEDRVIHRSHDRGLDRDVQGIESTKPVAIFKLIGSPKRFLSGKQQLVKCC